MSVRRIKAGSTDVSVILRIVDSTDGTPETGVVFNTAGIDLWYRRDLAASVDITEATLAALTTAHADGGFLHVNDGWYRLDLPDAACASGVAGVQIGGTVTGMVVFAPYIELPVNTEEDVFTRIGAPAGASVSADIAAIEAQTDDIGAAGAGLTAVPWNAAWDAEVQSEVADALAVYDPPTNAEMEARTLVSAGYATATALDTVDNLIDTEVAAIKTVVDAIQAKTDNLPTDPADQSLVIAATNAIAALIGTPVTDVSADIAAVKAETASILTDTAEIGAAGAGLTALATQVSVNDLPTNAELATALGTADDAVLAQVALVKAKTDSLTFTVAGKVDANTLAMNGTTVIGAGTALDKWRA
jgi:hypothetical protein